MKLVLLKSEFTLEGCNYSPRHFRHHIPICNDRTILIPYHADSLEEVLACHQFQHHLKQQAYVSIFGILDVYVTFNHVGEGAGLNISFPKMIQSLYDCFGADASISLKAEMFQLRNELTRKEFQNAKSKNIKLVRGESNAEDMGFPYENMELKTALKYGGILKGIMKVVLLLSDVALEGIETKDKDKEKVSLFRRMLCPFAVGQSDSKDGKDVSTSKDIIEKEKETGLDPNPIPFHPSISMAQQVNMRLLHQEIATDVLIFPRDGNPVKAHKAFLSVHSDVFMTMFQTEMEEAKTHTVRIQDMSEESVKALLAFLYYGYKSEANCNPMVAFELLYAGHKYNIVVLEETMRKLLLGKLDQWYNREVAMQLFILARNLPKNGNELKMKAMQILKKNFAELRQSQEYSKLFKENPDAAMELCNYLAE